MRPSYVLSGAAMNVAYSHSDLERFLALAADVSPEHPVVITKFLENAEELDIDAVASNGKVLVHAISQHVENAGVHSGDATLILPPSNLAPNTRDRMKLIADQVADAFQISGPFNMQIIHQPLDGSLKVIECNLRASRSFPFVSKVLDKNFIEVATRVLVKKDVPSPVDLMQQPYPYQAVKVSQFSWTRLAGADPMLGVEMSSTGEVACFGRDQYEAFYAAIQSVTNFKMPERGQTILVGYDDLTSGEAFGKTLEWLKHLGYRAMVVTNDQGPPFPLNSSMPYETVKPLSSDDRIHASSLFQSNNVGMVIQLAKRRPGDIQDPSYLLRRLVCLLW